MQSLLPMIAGSAIDGHKIFRRYPHITWDNHFSGDRIMDWLGTNGFGATMTCRRDRLPSGVPTWAFHRLTPVVNERTRVARFYQPVVAVKNVAASSTGKDYHLVHVSFQSTSSCNFTTVNALNTCKVGIEKRERGRGKNKMVWGIEMNHAWKLYLNTYSKIDVMDHLIQNCRIFYRSWKYWHSPMLHAMAMAIVVAYDMYCEVAEGELDIEWKVKPVEFWEFRDKLSKQMLIYQPQKKQYPGDELFRVNTERPKKKRRASPERDGNLSSGGSRGKGRPRQLTEEEMTNIKMRAGFTKAKCMRGSRSRLCGDLDRLHQHLKSCKTGKKHPKLCVVCGEKAYSVCEICGEYMHLMPARGENAGKLCFIDYHNDCFFGLAKKDVEYTGQAKKNWSYPSNNQRKRNKEYIENITASTEGDE